MFSGTALTCAKELIVNVWSSLDVLYWGWLELSSNWNLRRYLIGVIVVSWVQVSIEKSSRATLSTHHAVTCTTPTNGSCTSNRWLRSPSNSVDNATSSCTLSHGWIMGTLRGWLISIVIISYRPSNRVMTAWITKGLKVLLRRLIDSMSWSLSSLTWWSSTQFMLLVLNLWWGSLNMLLITSLLSTSAIPDGSASWVLHIATAATTCRISRWIRVLLVLLSVSSSCLLGPSLLPFFNIVRRGLSSWSLTVSTCDSWGSCVQPPSTTDHCSRSLISIIIKRMIPTLFILLIRLVLMVQWEVSMARHVVSRSLGILMPLNVVLLRPTS